MSETTALIKINPESDELITWMHEEALRAQEYAEARIILTDQDAKLATDDLSILSKLKKGFEEKRKEYVDPLNAYVKTINDTFKIFMGPLLAADVTTREKLLAYRHEQERKAAEAEEINRLRMEAARKEMELKGELTESVNLVEAIPLPAKTVIGDNGSASTSKVWKFEVTDFNLLPNDYKMVDSVKLGKVVRAGLHDIAGVKIWAEDSLRVTAR